MEQYHGPEKRKVSSQDTIAELVDLLRHQQVRANEKVLFGMLTVSDAIKIGSCIFFAVIFVVKDNFEKKQMQESQALMSESLKRLVDFTENSDGWNSVYFGTRFRGGVPIDTNFKVGNQGNRGNVNELHQ